MLITTHPPVPTSHKNQSQGFSYGDSAVKDHNEAGVEEDMYYFVQAFLAAHPQYSKNEFFVSIVKPANPPITIDTTGNTICHK